MRVIVSYDFCHVSRLMEAKERLCYMWMWFLPELQNIVTWTILF